MLKLRNRENRRWLRLSNQRMRRNQMHIDILAAMPKWPLRLSLRGLSVEMGIELPQLICAVRVLRSRWKIRYYEEDDTASIPAEMWDALFAYTWKHCSW